MCGHGSASRAELVGQACGGLHPAHVPLREGEDDFGGTAVQDGVEFDTLSLDHHLSEHALVLHGSGVTTGPTS